MFRNSLKMLLTGGKSNRKSRNSSDGGSEDAGDTNRTTSLDPHLYALTGQGGSVDSDCAFGDPDYAVPPPLAMVEGLQHVRMMEGVSRSLPSSPLLAHQHAGARLQPGRKIVGTGTPLCTMHSGTLSFFFF
ncbi:protein TANC2-like [Clupea harengus]|uniref:Protein TANC2-like n=1 Tax=Clupea harengus TaxID=7950 RepID=A0A6P8EZZ8_CLUHA|nr:protein TANC2-like [Clupea harengus]XP_031416461.1 protein TANC2-like [Clupea harengus]XP_031416462.1 protein TANC2-like [Clupea harengus]